MKKIDIITDDVVYNGKFIDMKQTLYAVNGDIFNWEYATRRNNSKAVMIIAHNDGKLLLTSEYRVPIKGREIGFPAGLIDDNEKIEDAIVREFKEETGMTIDKIYDISGEVYNSCGITDESIYISYCDCSGTISGRFLEKQEDIQAFFVDRKKASEILKNKNNKFGAKTWLILNEFVKFGWFYS